jgi:hypothetical protein
LSDDIIETDLTELLAQTYVQTIVGVPETRLNVSGARRQKVGSESMCGGSSVSVSRLVQEDGDRHVQAMSDSLLQDYKDTVQRRVGGLQRLCKFEVEGDGLAVKSVSSVPVGMMNTGAYARAWSPVDSMLDDGARHRAPMPGVVGDRAVQEVRCKRADIRRLRTGRCDPWRAATAESGDVCAQQG